MLGHQSTNCCGLYLFNYWSVSVLGDVRRVSNLQTACHGFLHRRRSYPGGRATQKVRYKILVS